MRKTKIVCTLGPSTDQPGILRQLEREFYTDDHRLWPKDAPEQPQQLSLIHI